VRAGQLSKTQPDDTKIANSQQLLQALPRSCWLPSEPDDEKEAQQKIIEQARRQQEARQAAQGK